MRRACDQCHGTDTQRECERGQCYAEEYQRQQDEEQAREAHEREQMEWQRHIEEDGQW